MVVDFKREPMASGNAIITAGENPSLVTTNGDGILECRVPRECTAAQADLGVGHFDLAVGALAPISEPSGQAARLMNLGYWFGDDDDREDPDALRLAIQLFQRDRGMSVTGAADSDFVTELDRVHDGRGEG